MFFKKVTTIYRDFLQSALKFAYKRVLEFLHLLNEFKDVFSVPGDVTRLPAKSEFEHKIVLKDPNKVHYAPPFPMPGEL